MVALRCLGLLFALAWSGLAFAQNNQVYVPGANNGHGGWEALEGVDNGNGFASGKMICTGCSGSGSGGAVTAIDGAFINLGTLGDAPYTGTGNASITAALKGIYALNVTIAGTPTTAAAMPAGGTGLYGWLSAIFTALPPLNGDGGLPVHLLNAITVTLGAGSQVVNTDDGVPATAYTYPSGASGIMGLLSDIAIALDKTNAGTLSSSSKTCGATSSNIVVSGGPTNYLLIQNPPTLSGNTPVIAWIGLNTAATAGPPSIALTPGNSMNFSSGAGSFLPNGAGINCIGASYAGVATSLSVAVVLK